MSFLKKASNAVIHTNRNIALRMLGCLEPKAGSRRKAEFTLVNEHFEEASQLPVIHTRFADAEKPEYKADTDAENIISARK